jgi:hypothetical protein
VLAIDLPSTTNDWATNVIIKKASIPAITKDCKNSLIAFFTLFPPVLN